MKKALPILALLLGACVLQSFNLFSNVITEKDEVSSSIRTRAFFDYTDTKEWHSPLVRIAQTILCETDRYNTKVVRVFDCIQLASNSFDLETRVYLLLDGTPYPIKVDNIGYERLSDLKEKKKDVLTGDSSKVSVVTGYDRVEGNFYKLTCTIPPVVVDKIKTCMKLQFRYYAGPDMITTTMSRYELSTFKKML